MFMPILPNDDNGCSGKGDDDDDGDDYNNNNSDNKKSNDNNNTYRLTYARILMQ